MPHYFEVTELQIDFFVLFEQYFQAFQIGMFAFDVIFHLVLWQVFPVCPGGTADDFADDNQCFFAEQLRQEVDILGGVRCAQMFHIVEYHLSVFRIRFG